MKIFVTGSAGFIGFHLCQQLLLQGYSVIGIDNLNDYYDPVLKQIRNDILLRSERYSFREIDITNFDILSTVIGEESPDMIVHLAAQAGVRYSLVNPAAYEHTNVLGTLNIFEAAKVHAVKKVVFASSSSVYGSNVKVPFSENDMTDSPISIYAATKKSSELIAHTYSHLYGIEAVGLRFFTVYGEWYRPDMALFSFSKNILEDRPICLFNSGEMQRDFTHVTDIVDGIIAAMKKEGLGFEIFNLGCDNPVSLGVVVAALEKGLNKKAKIEYLPMQAGDVIRTYADITKARTILGFNPKISIEEGIADFTKWFLEHQSVLLRLK